MEDEHIQNFDWKTLREYLGSSRHRWDNNIKWIYRKQGLTGFNGLKWFETGLMVVFCDPS